ncbi:MAG: hypothetical protein Q7U89_08495 [Coriobacteriia bacterium]|nr:hypothetical protein [Coriobacteriia bacterium]
MSARLTAEPARVVALQELYRAKLAEELRAARKLQPGADTVADSGDSEARVLFVKGEPGPAEVCGAAVLSGPDGRAAAKSLEALGFDPDSMFAMLARAVVPSTGDATGAGAPLPEAALRVRATAEAIDPYAIVALDPTAAIDLAAAFSVPPLRFGQPIRALGRVLLAVDGLEPSLGDPARKRRVWAQLRALKPDAPRW